MFEWTIDDRRFLVRELESIDEFHVVEDIQREAWQFSDLDVVPAATLIATQHAGGLLLGAFESQHQNMIGFAYAFPAFEHSRISLHSHMLAVLTEYRNCQAGFYLKVAQREYALQKGLDEITWTYDPLQTLNAHLNFGKLGVIARRYLVNFYGEETSSPLHRGFGTDRLWVSWLLDTKHVLSRIQREETTLRPDSLFSTSEADGPANALVVREGDRPRIRDFEKVTGNTCLIEIPQGINQLKEAEPELGLAWREATRAAFLWALEQNYFVQDFVRWNMKPPRWFYVLRRESS
ncbi:MAG TPA: hypothetical protein VKM94_08725 [Blastocatellia bacterium]|nr:hypothetical protein [Blastocatellia bacterium]